MSLRWYVIRTEPRSELLAANELSRDGFQVYLPRVRSPLPSHDSPESPLFPGYLFLQCDPDNEGWPLFRRSHRVAGLVNFGGEIPSLPDDVVTKLKEFLDGVNQHGGLWRRFRQGEQVRVTSKSLECLAEVMEESKSPHARVNVVLNFMGRMIRAQVPWNDLRPIEEQPQEKPRSPRRTRGGNRWVRGFRPAPSGATTG
jgi:transcriptional antiterminator RfaH